MEYQFDLVSANLRFLLMQICNVTAALQPNIKSWLHISAINQKLTRLLSMKNIKAEPRASVPVAQKHAFKHTFILIKFHYVFQAS